jgi:proteasome lid subunit RPN8/RPN11
LPGDSKGVGMPAVCSDKGARQWNSDFGHHKPEPTTTVPDFLDVLDAQRALYADEDLLAQSRLREVVIDRRLLDRFKSRCLKVYPREFLEGLWGRVNGRTIEIHAMQPVDHKVRRMSVDYTLEAEIGEQDNGLVHLGTIHSHTGSCECAPSELDLKSARADREIVMGICAIRLRNGRKFTSFGFFRGKRQLELRVSE